VLQTFELESTGNVALRGLTLLPVTAGALSALSCEPPATGDGLLVCQAEHRITQEEVESGVSQVSVVVSADNIDPQTGQSFSRQLQLLPVNTTSVASLTGVCSKLLSTPGTHST
jgi:hypothetical protein